MNKFIENLDFKKIAISYIIISIIAIIIITGFIGYTFKDKLQFLFNYHNISDMVDEGKYTLDSLKEKIQNMSDISSDVKDILILDSNNNILYSSKNSEFSKQEELVLDKATDMGKGYFTYSDNENVVLKLVTNEELILNTVLSNFDGEIQSEYEDEIFYQQNLDSKDIYLLSYTVNENTGEKIYFISEIQPVANGEIYIKIALSIIMFLFMVYWILIALYIYKNALKSKLNPYLWGGITLITNIAGVIIYIIYKQNNETCIHCGAVQSKGNIYCINCGKKIKETCKDCNSVIDSKAKYCYKCGKEQK